VAHAALKKLPPARVSEYTNAVLGRRFDLSVAYMTRAKMRVMNRTYRSVDAPTDILSFQLSKTSGQILLCMPEVVTHAKAFAVAPNVYLPYLFIHGLIHVKGHDHGRIMDSLEQKFCNRFELWHPHAPQDNKKKTNGTKNRSRH
jgi:probable rRNA maturation factor